jgi:N-dimethylarginine dimethylaminohydrolase
MNMHATFGPTSQPRFLMCPPRHFAVTYSINPWMDPQAWADGGAALHDKAQTQWAGLRYTLAAAGAAVELMEPASGLPDLVFTANAAVVLDRTVMLARFRHGERRNEEPLFAIAFVALKARGLLDEVLTMPEGVMLEGAGDCIFDARRGLFWMGCGFRSDAAAAPVIAERFGVRCVSLPLADPSFYHLDTALCALPCGGVIYYPAAFTPEALSEIHARVAPADRIALSRADAARFAANAVCIDRTIVVSSASAALKRKLAGRGYAVAETPLDIFRRSGGSACCLTLRLGHQSRTIGASVEASESGDVVSERAVRPAGRRRDREGLRAGRV